MPDAADRDADRRAVESEPEKAEAASSIAISFRHRRSRWSRELPDGSRLQELPAS
jgi:hypothetical protein